MTATYRQRLDVVAEAIVRSVDHRQPTTYREVAADIGLPVSVVHARCRRLVDRGLLTHAPGIPRTLRCDPSVVVLPGRGVHQMERIG